MSAAACNQAMQSRPGCFECVYTPWRKPSLTIACAAACAHISTMQCWQHAGRAGRAVLTAFTNTLAPPQRPPLLVLLPVWENSAMQCWQRAWAVFDCVHTHLAIHPNAYLCLCCCLCAVLRLLGLALLLLCQLLLPGEVNHLQQHRKHNAHTSLLMWHA